MNPPPGNPPPQPDGPPLILPDLHTTLLDPGQIEQLFHDIEQCGQNLEIIPKFAARAQVAPHASLSLAEARDLLANQAVRGLQLRYRHEGADWWDTLMPVGGQVRLVRVRHDIPAP